MILERWKLFSIVASLGSLSKASVVADRPQSVISRQINALERDCGARLFLRTGRGVVLSEIGEAILPQVNQLIQNADQLMLDIREKGGVPVGPVTIGLLPSLVRPLAVKLMRRAAEKFPHIRFHIVEANTGQLAEMIATGRCDIALLFREPEGALQAEELVLSLPVYLVGPAGDPLTRGPTVAFKDLAGVQLVMSAPTNVFRTYIEQTARKQGVDLSFVADGDSLTIQRESVIAGFAHSVMTRLPVTEELERGEVQCSRIVEPDINLRVVLAMTTQRPMTLAMRETYKLVRAAARELAADPHVLSGPA